MSGMYPELIKLGFLEHVKEVKAAGGDHLFPDLKRSKADGKFTDPLSKWFSRYLKKVGAHTPQTTFHSLRHGVSACLKEADISPHKMDQILGWKGVSMRSRYGKSLNPASLLNAIKAIRYPGLDLSHLYPGSQ